MSDIMIVLDTMHRVPTPAHFISVLICETQQPLCPYRISPQIRLHHAGIMQKILRDTFNRDCACLHHIAA